MENKIWKIYKYKNKINNKCYVGQTCNSLYERSGKNGIGYRHCSKFYNAIKKYGWNNFICEILKENISQEEANDLEVYYISKLDSINNGYNITIGGNCGSYGRGITIYQYSINGDYLKTWKSIGDIARWFNVADASMVYSCIKGTLNSWRGYQWTNFKNEKIDKTYNRNYDGVPKTRKKVYQYTFEGEFIREYKMLSEVSMFGFSYKNVSSCCLGKSQTYANFQWRYEYFSKLDSAIDPFILSSSKQCKKVYKYDKNFKLVDTYDSLSIADKENGIYFKNISRCCICNCKNLKHTCGGWFWSYNKM